MGHKVEVIVKGKFAIKAKRIVQPKSEKPRVTTTELVRPNYISPQRGDYSLSNSELIFSAVSRIANALSAMPIQLYEGSTPVNDWLNDLVADQPNPNMTSCQFIRTLETCRCTYGNGYALKVYDSKFRLQRLDVLKPERVTPLLDSDSGELWYRIATSPDDYPKGEMLVHNFHMIHVSFLSTNGYKGVNPVSVLCNTLDYNDNIQKFSKQQLENGVNAAIVLEAPSNLNDDKKEEMISRFLDTYKKTRGNILLLESGVTAKSLNLSPVKSELFDVERISRSKIATVYNIPPHLLGDYSDVSFASQEQQMLEFLMLTMHPIVVIYEQEFKRKLLSVEERQRKKAFKFTMDSMLRADAATMADVNLKAIRSGTKLIDEVRASQGYAPLPDGIGQQALVSQDLAPLEYTVNTKPDVLAAKLRGNNIPSPE